MDPITQRPQEVRKFEPFSTEDEIKILERRLQLLREGLQPRKGSEEEATTTETKESEEKMESGVGEVPGGAPPPPPQPASPMPMQVSDHYHNTKVGELKTYESDKQLKALVEIAFERSVADAVDIARRLDDAHLLDEFHDVLQDDERVRSTLIESGKLKEI